MSTTARNISILRCTDFGYGPCDFSEELRRIAALIISGSY